MTREKKPTTKVEEQELAPEVAQASADIQNTVAALQTAHSDDRDLLNQLLGQAQMADSFAKFSVTVTTSKLAYVKENKLYKALAGKKTGDGHQFSGTWEEFCFLLGRSREQVDEDIRNLNSLGADALESMSRMGIGYRELRQYRRLPEDEKTALLEAAKTGDKDTFLDLAEEIISRNAASKALADENYAELQKEHQTQGEILAEAKQEALTLKAELKKLKPGTAIWENSIAELKEEITNLQNFIDESVARQDEAIDAIDSWLTQHVVNQPGYDPETPFVMPAQALTVLVHLDDCINRSAHLVAAARHKLHNEFGAELADARRHLLADSEE